jgi:endogenous inhibitor of DNA gyrase (YacG/DUF329 family)
MAGQQSEWPEHPFCSPRCKKIDLGRWLGEKYTLPASEDQSSDAKEEEED